MANILGSLFVDLRANTAEFINGMSKAGAHAARTGKEIEHSFSDLGNILSNVLGPLGNIGQEISNVASGVGDAIGGTMKDASKLSSAMTAVGAAGVAGFGLAAAGAIHLADRAAEMGSKIFEASEVTGLSASHLSGLAAVSEVTGESFDTLSDSLARAGKNLHQALLEPGEVTAKVLIGIMGGAKNLAALGLMPMDDAIQTVLHRIFALNNEGERNLALNALLGRGWLTNVESLKMLADQGYGPAIAQAKKMGMYFNDESARQAKEFSDAMTELKAAIGSLGLEIGQALIPQLLNWMQGLQGLLPRIESWGDAVKAVALALTGRLGEAAKAWSDYQKRSQEAIQAQTDFLVHLQTMTDDSKKASSATLSLGNAHTKAARQTHEHAAAARDLDRAYTDIIPHLLTVDEELQRMAASDYEDKIRSLAQGLREVPDALTAGGAPTGGGMAGADLLGGMNVPPPPVVTAMQQLRAQFQSFFSDIADEGKGLGDKVFGSLGDAVNGISDQLAHLAVTGKANFKDIFENLEGSLAKSGIQTVFGAAAGKVDAQLGLKTPGAAKTRGDSPATPMYTREVGSLTGGKLGGLAGASGAGGGGGESAGGLGGLFKGITSKVSGTFGSMWSGISGVIGQLGKSMGSVFSSIGGIFGGFLAHGGDVTPGKAYVVGEKHPEFFVPKQGGRVAPSLQMGSQRQTVLNFNVGNVQDADSFKHSQGQIMAMLQNQMAHANARNQ